MAKNVHHCNLHGPVVGFSLAERPCNQSHNILRLFDVLSNFPFTTGETMDD